MNKLKRIIMLLVILITVTGCVKLEMSMDIKSDKSMTLGIIQAINKSLLEQGNSNMINEEEIAELKKAGYTVEKYSKDDMEGYQITIKIKNIDTVSTDDDITTDLGASKLTNNKYIFTVKKGLFKNTYKATLKSSDSEEATNSLDSQIGEDTTYDDSDVVTDEEDIYTEDNYLDDELTEDNLNGDAYLNEDFTEYDYSNENSPADDNNSFDYDYSSLLSSMDLTMKVNLPHPAISSNATTIDNNGKTLTWDLMNFEEETMNFEFELYNTTNFILIAVFGLLIILIIILIIIKTNKKKKKQTNETLSNNNTNLSQGNNVEPTNTQNIESIQQQEIINNEITNQITGQMIINDIVALDNAVNENNIVATMENNIESTETQIPDQIIFTNNQENPNSIDNDIQIQAQTPVIETLLEVNPIINQQTSSNIADSFATETEPKTITDTTNNSTMNNGQPYDIFAMDLSKISENNSTNIPSQSNKLESFSVNEADDNQTPPLISKYPFDN